MATSYNKEKLIEAIKAYEERTNNRQFKTLISETPTILLFSRGKKERLCALSTHIWPLQDIDKIMISAAATYNTRDKVSDTIILYSIAVIDSSTENQLKYIAATKYDFNLEIIDKSNLKKLDEFQGVFEKEKEDDEISLIERALYDYLASSDESSYLKNSLYYSLILLCLYNNPKGLSIAKLNEVLTEKIGKKIEKLDVAIRILRKDGHIAPLKSGDTNLYLTQTEKDNIYDSIQRSKSAEQQFNEIFTSIIEKYGISDSAALLNKLRDIIVSECKNIDEEGESINLESYALELNTFTSPDNKRDFLKDLSSLLNDNDHLITLSLGEKFLDLYRSDRYETYINSKENIVIVDTMVFIYLLCCKSSYNEKIVDDWQDGDYQRVCDLCGYWEENKDNLSLVIPADYIEETIGEIRKSLQLTWFTQIELPIPLETSNIFYNYYQHICITYKIYEEEVPSYEEFLSDFGFKVLDTDSIYFKREVTKTLNVFLRTFGIASLKHPLYEGFDDVKREYLDYLISKNKHKTDSALNSDVRLSFYLANKFKEGYNESEYYWTSWDKTLRELRRITNNYLCLTHSYEIRTPGDLIQTLAFKSFKLNKAIVGKEVLTYANETFGFTSKASSLFDNILNPYFASKNNSNTDLVKLLLKLETSNNNQSIQEDSARKNTKTVLEDFFTLIIEKLAKNTCGTNDLRKYLADSDNNDVIVGICKEAYNTDVYSEKEKLAYQFIDNLKKFIVANTKQENEQFYDFLTDEQSI